MYADGQVMDDADAHARLARGPPCGGQLPVGQPGEPAVEVDPVHQLVPGAGGLGRTRVLQAGRPGVPVGAVQLGDGAPGGMVLQGPALLGQKVAVGGAAAGAQRDAVHDLQGLALERPDGVPVDQRALLQHRFAQLGRLLAERVQPFAVVGADVRVLGDVLDPQMDGVGEAARRRPVRGGVGGRAGYGRVQRVDLHEPGPERPPGPGGELGEIAEVAHAPGAGGEEGVELYEKAVRAPLRLRRPDRRDDESGAGGAPVGSGDVQLVHTMGKSVPPGTTLGGGSGTAGTTLGGGRGPGRGSRPTGGGLARRSRSTGAGLGLHSLPTGAARLRPDRAPRRRRHPLHRPARLPLDPHGRARGEPGQRRRDLTLAPQDHRRRQQPLRRGGLGAGQRVT